MGRSLLALAAGLSVSLLIILLLRVMTLALFPFPDELVWLDSNDMTIYLESLPDKAFVFIILSHILGAFCGSLISSLVAKSARFTHGIIVGSIIFIIVIITNFTFDFPVLYLMLDTLLTGVAGFSGAAFGYKRSV